MSARLTRRQRGLFLIALTAFTLAVVLPAHLTATAPNGATLALFVCGVGFVLLATARVREDKGDRRG